MLKIGVKFAFSVIFTLSPFYGYEIRANDLHICEQDLGREINAILDEPIHRKATWGILVKQVNSENILYALNSDKYFIPASNTKVLTTAAALLKFGANYQISTPIYFTGDKPSLDTLTIVGRGDPTITTAQLEAIARQLKNEGITNINQLIIKDDALFSDMINGTWENSDLPYYYAPAVSNIILNENTVTINLMGERIDQPAIVKWSDNLAGKQWQVINNVVTTEDVDDNNIQLIPNWQESTIEIVGELGLNQESRQWWLSIPNPHQYFLDSLTTALKDYDISVSTTRVVNENREDLSEGKLLMEIKSANLSEMITTTNKDSNNLFAEILLRLLEEENKTEFETQKEVLNTIGVDSEGYYLRDGSGLSRHNLITPLTMVSTLEGMIYSGDSFVFRQSLPVAGVDGTLRNRFQDTPAQGNFAGKTGTLTGVTALSGYLEMEDYPDLIISLMVNKSAENAVVLRETTDNIVNTIAQVRECP